MAPFNFLNVGIIKQKAFMRILNDNKSDSFIKIHKFVKDNNIPFDLIKPGDKIKLLLLIYQVVETKTFSILQKQLATINGRNF